jgi:hypothetical protein
MDCAPTQIDAAVDQLDWAIRLFLDHAAFVPAITLAGAPGEIIGETLGDQSTCALLKVKLCADFNLSEKVV